MAAVANHLYVAYIKMRSSLEHHDLCPVTKCAVCCKISSDIAVSIIVSPDMANNQRIIRLVMSLKSRKGTDDNGAVMNKFG